ncbi:MULTISPECIES: YajG family lipoprotein [unclassified Halomonas]|uniref:YajG family lipoprotein n=1 Tax=unclassified Halomonas TaxID=2609666 RepID=UPI0021E4A6F4|nr:MULTISPECIES: YajG family lipoprotein [unclassified Halomonas]UYG01061.1 YajG family lipoprotein [Halomonas sp. GD1P12]WNL37877.1 YajG family lipoprotein [Halomonas sp. PAMB 3232]
MLRRHFLTLTTALVAGAWLTGCASPQYLQLSPERTAEVPKAGSGQQVSVAAVDARESEVIGTRAGGSMSTAQITVNSHELVPRLQAEAERAVREMGFNPTSSPVQNAPSLTLELASLHYGQADSGQPLVDEARIEAVFRAIAQNRGTTYTGTYTSRRTQGYAIKPGEATNTRMINDLLSDGMNRAFSDPELARLLAR